MKFFKKGPMPIQKRTAPPAKVGGWLAAPVNVKTEERKAQAVHPAHSTLMNSSLHSIYGHGNLETNAPNRTLSTDQLWQCYYRVPEVRACVDSIARRVSTWDWSINVSDMIDKEDAEHYQEMVKMSRSVQRFMKNPDKDGRTFQQFIFMIIVDLLVFDAAAIEPVKDRKKRIQELRARRGDDFRVKTDRYGQVEGYVQHAGLAGAIEFKRDELVYMNLFPNTTYPEGMPIIETILNEIVSVLRYGERAMKTADANEVPPGLLVLSGVSGRAAQDAMQDFRSEAGNDQKLRMLHFPSPQAGSADWINMQTSAKEMELSEVIERITRTIWRAFGVMPVEMGAVSDINRSTAQAQLDVSSSHLITPILELIEGMFNNRIIPALAEQLMGEGHRDHIEFKFDREAKLTQKDQEARIDMLGRAVGAGMMSRNEAREALGLLPINNGDTMTVGEGNMILRLEDVTVGVTPIQAYADSAVDTDEDPDDDEDPSDDDGQGHEHDDSDEEGEEYNSSHNRAKKSTKVSEAVKKNLRKQAKDHNEEVGNDKRKRTTYGKLVQVFRRGVGAYHNNPGSVRPSVKSPDQWAYARVKSFRYVLRNLKFRSGKHDTDLLPKSHPMHSKGDERAVGDTDPTNFPSKGDDKKVSLRNSKHGIFDPEYAADLKENWPQIWKKGGNIKGNAQYAALKPVVANGGAVNTEGEERAVRLREAWGARHTGDHRLAGVVAQIKWFVVGSRGEGHMKEVIAEAKKKLKK